MGREWNSHIGRALLSGARHLRLIDRYLLGQLMGPTLLATAALSGVALLSQSLSALDILVDQRQGPLIFAKITLLAMPQLVALILPVAILVAAFVALNRLQTEQEITICFTGGMSRWRVISPAIRLAAVVALISLCLSLWIQPLCFRVLRETLDEVRTDLAAALVKPGQFTHPAPGVTVYVQSADDLGGLHNIFIDVDRSPDRDTTITARAGMIAKRAGAPVLVMRQGATEEYSSVGVLNFLSFDEYVFDLRALAPSDHTVSYKLSDRYPHELFFPDTRREWERANRSKMLAEGHSRFAAPLYNLAFMALALAAVIGGPFSRMGYGARIATAGAAALITRTLGVGVQAAASGSPSLNVLQYLVPLVAVAASALILYPPATPLSRTRFSHASVAPALRA
jgi:lipopolysaccharide export system permease protein